MPRTGLRLICGFVLGMVFSTAQASEAEWKLLSDQVVPFLTTGNVDWAEIVAREALDKAQKVFGESHRNTEISLAHMGLVLRFRSRYEEAEKHYRRALAIREKALGRNHPSLLHTLNNLIAVLEALGRVEEAEQLRLRGATIGK
jgi:tetratricopeptide (TPR) repeat protein